MFDTKDFIMHSGAEGTWKIECDNLTDSDLDTLVRVITRKIRFSEVYGIPTGGHRLADRLRKHTIPNSCLLIVDDVLTTGNSMEEAKKKFGRLNTTGVVIFARTKPADWIHPIFQLSEYYND